MIKLTKWQHVFFAILAIIMSSFATWLVCIDCATWIYVVAFSFFMLTCYAAAIWVGILISFGEALADLMDKDK
jgi:hypothetical protein